MAAVDTEPAEDRTRVWGIILMGLLSVVLTVVLIRTRPSEHPEAQEPSSPPSVQGATAPPEQGAPDSPQSNSGAYYRGWPMFEGWPLPQVPSGTGGSGSETDQGQHPKPQAPPEAGAPPPASAPHAP